ncbi:MAG: 4-hydroxy-tetrahydrodipicolinate synthase [Chlamydiota bacterium]
MFRGSCVALATPFNADQSVNLERIRELVEWHIASGTQAIVLCGSTGEAPTLCDEETLAIFAAGVEAACGRIPIIAGTGGYDTRHVVSLTEQAKELGVDGALVVEPYYVRPHPEGCFLHFQKICAVGLPVIFYHNPWRTGINLPVSQLARICTLPNLAAVKEASGNLDYTLELMSQIEVPVYGGDDTLALPMMAVGAVGVISIVANVIPEEWQQFNALMLSGDLSAGRSLFHKLYPLIKAMVLETNPQCVKYALSLLGKCTSTMRLPLIEPQEPTRARIAQALEVVCLNASGG